MSSFRRCEVLGGMNGNFKYPVPALFYKWIEELSVVGERKGINGHAAGQIKKNLALVELDDGSIKLIKPEFLRFTDRIKEVSP